MTLKELSQLYYLNREIERDLKRLSELRARVSSPAGSNLTGMPFSGSKVNVTEKLIIDIVTVEQLINKKTDRCVEERKKLEKYIRDIPDSLIRQIFTLRFVEGLSWRQVAFAVGGNNTEDSVKKICYRYLK